MSYGPGLEDRVRAAAPGGIDAVLDGIGGDALDVSMKLVAGTTWIVTIADWTAPARLGIRRIGTDRSAARLTRLTRRYAEVGLTSWYQAPSRLRTRPPPTRKRKPATSAARSFSRLDRSAGVLPQEQENFTGGA